MLKELTEKVELKKPEIIDALSELIRIKALSPENGGDGELEKAEYLVGLLDGFEVKRYDAKDRRAKKGTRPNIVAKIEGKIDRTLWIVTHLDVVPEGDLLLWKTPPFEPIIKDGKIYGRGSEDNGQSIVSSLFAAKVIKESDKIPNYSFGVVFVSDEEVGSKYGIQHLLQQNIFRKDDLIIVPDAGDPKGDKIEIAEKGILWLKFTVKGVQAHASKPAGINAAREAARFLIDVDTSLHKKFKKKNALFNPPISTFEPTKREKNVDNVNTIPGLDISYIDCRIIPDYDIDDVIDYVYEIKKNYSSVDVEVIQKESSPLTPPDSEVVRLLSRAIEILRGVKPNVYGVGGNTCAAFFRKAGFHTAVWSTVDGTAHQPNEYAVIDNIIKDAKVFAVLPFL